jgi:hypothetical protein
MTQQARYDQAFHHGLKGNIALPLVKPLGLQTQQRLSVLGKPYSYP